jgi:4-hydroxy-2-oxoglutarate aldolase
MNEKLKGIIVPAVTPFDQDGNILVDHMEENFSRWTATGIRGIMVLGSNGEFKSLTDKESLEIIKYAARFRGDKTLIVGAGRESLYQTVRFIEEVSVYNQYIDYISVLTPNYFGKNLTGDDLYDYFAAVANSSSIPILLYNAPTFANGVSIPAKTLAKLADHPNIAGIKDTSKDQLTRYMVYAGGRDDFEIMAGSIGTIMTDLFFGGPGGVVSAANYFPAECAQLTDLFFKGEISAYMDLYKELFMLVEMTGGKSGVASVKATMNLLGFQAGIPRSPVSPLSKKEEENIRQVLETHNKL